MPTAEEGVGITVVKGRVAAQLGDRILAGSTDRQQLLAAQVSVTYADLTLADALNSSAKTLERALEGKQLSVIRSQEIDAFGETDFFYQARRVMTDTLFDLKKAMVRLAKHGFNQIVIAADHGHVMLPELSDEMKVDPPGGEQIELHRRCWIGRGGTTSNAFVRFRAAELGMGGDVELAFPRGLAVFKAGGGSAYLHGGLSLQELIVPIVTISLESIGVRGEGDQLTLEVTSGRITNQIFTVKALIIPGLAGKAEDRRQVHCTVVVGKESVGQTLAADEGFIPGNDDIALVPNEENIITLRLRIPAGSGMLKVQLLDANTGMTLAEHRDIQYEISHDLML